MPSTTDLATVRAFVERHAPVVPDQHGPCPECEAPIEHCYCPPDFSEPDLVELSDADLAAHYREVQDDLMEEADGTPEDGPMVPPTYAMDVLDELFNEILRRHAKNVASVEAYYAERNRLTSPY